jgi:AcrR family transcriptional regulator
VPSAETRRAAGRPEQVTLEQLRQTALRVADRDGAQELSMRGVARECGVSAMALYRHVASLEQLQELVVDEALRGLLAEPVAGSWRDKVAEMMTRTRARLLSHPGAAGILTMRPAPVTEIVRIADWYFGVLEVGGLYGADVARAFDALSAFLLGSVLFELTRQPGARVGLLDRATPKDTAHLDRYREQLGARDGDAYFRFGLDALLDGIERKLRPREPHP